MATSETMQPLGTLPGPWSFTFCHYLISLLEQVHICWCLFGQDKRKKTMQDFSICLCNSIFSLSRETKIKFVRCTKSNKTCTIQSCWRGIVGNRVMSLWRLVYMFMGELITDLHSQVHSVFFVINLGLNCTSLNHLSLDLALMKGKKKHQDYDQDLLVATKKMWISNNDEVAVLRNYTVCTKCASQKSLSVYLSIYLGTNLSNRTLHLKVDKNHCTLIMGLKTTEGNQPNELADLDFFSSILKTSTVPDLAQETQTGTCAKK